jgi:tRNA-dihydrouridine synthase A
MSGHLSGEIPTMSIDHRLSVAPMMDVTDRHCRFFLRQITRRTLLYTEMITTGALLHADVDRHLRFHPDEHPLALQLGGSEPEALAQCARIAAAYGYDEINLNIGCPSERVQRGAFGACLMAEPELVADCVQAMRDATPLPVTVKHRIGIGRSEDYDFMRRFVETVARAGCTTFIVHARNAILHGLSPKQNREIPPLRHDFVLRLKNDHPELEIVINGGIRTWSEVDAQLAVLDGVMLGRAAQSDPWLFAQADAHVFADASRSPSRADVVERVADYAAAEIAAGTPLRHIVRHLHALYRGRPVARRWRQMLSDARALAQNDAGWLRAVLEAVEQREYVSEVAAADGVAPG